MQISNILLPIDGSPYSDHAIEHAIYVAGLTGARITAVNCYEWHGHMPEVPEPLADELKEKATAQAAALLGGAKERMKNAGIDYTAKVMHGSPAKVLTKLAQSGDFDLIVMGSHGHSDIAGLFLGSVTHKVLNTIYCPVLVVP